MSRDVGIKNIAQEAGVSESAVSQILKGKGRFSSEKRAQIIDIAERLKYRPNLLIRAIQQGQTKTIGVMMATSSSFHALVSQGICREADRNNYVCFFICPQENGDDDGTEFMVQQLHHLIDRRVDGLIIMNSNVSLGSDEVVNEVRLRQIPKVMLDLQIPHIPADFVGVDDELGGRLAARHLIAHGHREIGVVALQNPLSTSLLRQQGFEAEARALGITCRLLHRNTFTSQGVTADLRQWLGEYKALTGVFCANDFMAGDVYRAAREMGKNIPQDLSVIGFGNLDVGSFLYPELTSIDQFALQEGCEAVKMLLRRIKGELPEALQQYLIKPELISRASVKSII